MFPFTVNDAPNPSFEPGRRLRVGFQVTVAVVALAAILVMLNWLAVRHARRWDWSGSDRFALSPLTGQVLLSLTNRVKITALYTPTAELYGQVEGLLREYARRSTNIELRFVDHISQPGIAANLKTQHQLAAELENAVLFEADGRFRVVSAGEMSVFQASPDFARTREVRRAGFKGEMLFTSALAGLIDPRRPRVCFLQGHGEHDPESDDRLFGYSTFGRLLAEKNVAVEPLNLAGANEAIPADCQLIIIAGPRSTPHPSEVAKLDRFLDQGGRVLLLTHPLTVSQPTGFESLLTRWGLYASTQAVEDEVFTVTKADVLSKNLAGHPITSPIARAGGFVYLPKPRVVTRLPDAARSSDTPKGENLVLTSTNGVTKSSFRDGVAYAVPGRDFSGEVPLAAAVEKGGLPGVDASRGTARLVVIGDSAMFGNDAIMQGANRDFASLTLAWLLDRSQLLSIGPKPLNEYRLNLTARQLRALRLTLLGALPGGVLALGFVVWFRRRS